jgi:hypothetical protein
LLIFVLSICKLSLERWYGRDSRTFWGDDPIGGKLVGVGAKIVPNLNERLGLHGLGNLVPDLSMKAQESNEINLLLT